MDLRNVRLPRVDWYGQSLTGRSRFALYGRVGLNVA